MKNINLAFSFHLMNGKLITFEGIDGSGKTTIAKMLYEKLKNKAILTAEPTKTWIGEAVNRAIEERKDAKTIALLFIADRNEHTIAIKKWLNEGKIVLCDRYIDSTFAYQKEHLKMEHAEQWLYEIHKPFLTKPDITFLFVISPEEAIERIKGRKLIMYEDTNFLEKVQKNYLEIAKMEEERFIIINAEKSKEEILKECWNALKHRNII
ncbi:MAG: dTMP kinase [Thermoplasmata archaeon]|nr:MAG: dTMP kinase [Thermoplasmata archaeon]